MLDPYCPDCRELQGYRRTRQSDGRGGTYSALAKCNHGASTGAGFEPVGSVIPSATRNLALAEAALMPTDKKIAATLQGHVGRANAIRAAELAVGIFDGAGDPSRKEEVRRGVTQSIERLRTFARLPIAATKEPPYGYFLAETDEEWDDMHERYMRELVRIAKLARLFRPQADIVQRLRGQLQLSADSAEVKV